MNLKDAKTKKYIIGATIAAAVIGVGVFTSAQIDFARNVHVSVVSTLSNLKENILEDKDLLLEIEKEVKETESEESKFSQMESQIKKIKDADCFDDSKINENIAMFDNFNKELDKIMTLYNNNSAVDEDILLVNKREEVKMLNNFVDEMMFEYNNDYLPEFNKRIATFPASIYANSQDWNKVNEFKSIDMNKK